MIARIRGEHDTRGRWRIRPSTHPPAAVAPQDNASRLEQNADDPLRALDRPRRRQARRLAVALLIAGGIAAGYQLSTWGLDKLTAPSRATALPATPRAWLDAYEAAAIDNPPRVCTQLFSPSLATAYADSAHESCTHYFQRIDSSSVQVRRILHAGATAVLELSQATDHQAWAVVLNRSQHGWQAVDLLPGQAIG